MPLLSFYLFLPLFPFISSSLFDFLPSSSCPPISFHLFIYPVSLLFPYLTSYPHFSSPYTFLSSPSPTLISHLLPLILLPPLSSLVIFLPCSSTLFLPPSLSSLPSSTHGKVFFYSSSLCLFSVFIPPLTSSFPSCSSSLFLPIFFTSYPLLHLSPSSLFLHLPFIISILPSLPLYFLLLYPYLLLFPYFISLKPCLSCSLLPSYLSNTGVPSPSNISLITPFSYLLLPPLPSSSRLLLPPTLLTPISSFLFFPLLFPPLLPSLSFFLLPSLSSSLLLYLSTSLLSLLSSTSCTIS